MVSGYMGGASPNPSYMEVCSGDTGHAEVIQLDFDPEVVTYEELLLIFFKTHSPTSLNRQGNDVGTQYRSVIFYHTPEQKVAAEKMIDELTREMVFDKPIVTEVSPATDFYRAENYHQNYYNENSSKPYCMFVIQPKLSKFAENFKEKIKPELMN